MTDLLLFLWLLSCVIAPILGTTCYDFSTSSSWGYSFDCPNGCCGSYKHEYCCMADAAETGIIIGSTFAAVAVAVIIILCIRYHMRKTVIIRPLVVSAVAVVSHGTSASTYPTSAAYPPQTYPPQVYPPPAYSNPAFPPPPYPNEPEPANAPANMATAQPQK